MIGQVLAISGQLSAIGEVEGDDWTAKSDLLAWAGLSEDAQASQYDCHFVWWAVANPIGDLTSRTLQPGYARVATLTLVLRTA